LKIAALPLADDGPGSVDAKRLGECGVQRINDILKRVGDCVCSAPDASLKQDRKAPEAP